MPPWGGAPESKALRRWERSPGSSWNTKTVGNSVNTETSHSFISERLNCTKMEEATDLKDILQYIKLLWGFVDANGASSDLTAI